MKKDSKKPTIPQLPSIHISLPSAKTALALLDFGLGLGRTALRPRWNRRYSSPGTVPGHFQVDPSALKSKLSYIRFNKESMQEGEVEDTSALKELAEPGKTFWLMVEGLGDEQKLRAIQGCFKLHRLAMEDTVNLGQRAKVEDYPDHLYIIIHVPLIEGGFRTEQVSIYIRDNCLITFFEKPIELLKPVLDRIRSDSGIIRSQGPDYIAYAVIDAIVDSYYPPIDKHGEQLEALELVIASGKGQDPMTVLYAVRQDLIAMRRALWQIRETTTNMTREHSGRLSETARLYLRDCQDHATELLEQVENFRDVTSDLMNLHFNNINTKMNEVMRLLTIVGAIFIPLNFIAALYGMNFNPEISPMNMPETQWYYGYPFAIALMVSMTLLLLGYFRYKRWI